MSAITEELHGAFLRPLGDAVIRYSRLAEKPLSVDLALPLPPRLRLYMYSLVGGIGEKSRHEYKVVLRVPRQPVGQYEFFDYSGGRIALVVGYRADLDVFVLWDASLHPRFKNGNNIQVRDRIVHTAAAVGRAEQTRSLSNGLTELVIACQSSNLVQAIDDRVALTGAATGGQWATSRN